MIYVDSREAAQSPSLVSFLSQHTWVEQTTLPYGDYLLTAHESRRPLLVERKTVNDMLASLANKRIFDQLLGLSSQKNMMDVAIILEGSLWQIEKFREWSPVSFMRFLDSVVLVWGIPIIPSYNSKWTAGWLLAKSKELDTEYVKREYTFRSVPRKMSLSEHQVYVMEGVIGHKAAIALLTKFGSIRNIAEASKEELEIKGLIGKKKANKIWEIFNVPWSPPTPEETDQAGEQESDTSNEE